MKTYSVRSGFGNRFEHIQKIIERSSSRHANQRLGFAPRMRAHTCSPARHGNHDLQCFSHVFILNHKRSEVNTNMVSTIRQTDQIVFHLDILPAVCR